MASGASTAFGIPYLVPGDAPDIAYITQAIANALETFGKGYIGSDSENGPVVLSNINVKAGSSAYTWTVPPGGRRYEIRSQSTYSAQTSAGGYYGGVSMVVAGASANASTGTNVGSRANTVLSSGAGSATVNTWGFVFLAAGVWTAFPGVQRVGGGDPTDTCTTDRVVVLDVAQS